MSLDDLSDEELTSLYSKKKKGIGNISFKNPSVESEYSGVNPGLQDILKNSPYPLTVTSGRRSPETNSAVGGAPHSKHLFGNASDIRRDDNALNARNYLKSQGVSLLDEGDHLHIEGGSYSSPPKQEEPTGLDALSDQELKDLYLRQQIVENSRKATQEKPPKSNALLTFGRNAMKSASAGLSEPIAAGASALTEKYPGMASMVPMTAIPALMGKLNPTESDQINQGKHLGTLYDENRIGLRKSLEEQNAGSPNAEIAGNITGFIAPGGAFSGLTKGVGKGLGSVPALAERELAKAALEGGLSSATYDAIDPETDISAKNLAIGATLNPAGKLIGKGLSKVINKTEDVIEKAPAKMMNKAVGTTAKEIERGRDIGQDLVDRSISGSKKTLLKKSTENLKKNAKKLDDILADKGAVDKQDIIDPLLNLKDKTSRLPDTLSDAQIAKIDDLVNDTVHNPKFKKLTAAKANELKGEVDDLLNDNDWLRDADTPTKKVIKAYRYGLKRSIEKVAPEAKSINKELGLNIKLKKKMLSKMAKEDLSGGNPVREGVSRTGSGALGYILGGPSGAGIGVAGNELARVLSKSTTAQTKGAIALDKGMKGFKKLRGSRGLKRLEKLGGRTGVGAGREYFKN